MTFMTIKMTVCLDLHNLILILILLSHDLDVGEITFIIQLRLVITTYSNTKWLNGKITRIAEPEMKTFLYL